MPVCSICGLIEFDNAEIIMNHMREWFIHVATPHSFFPIFKDDFGPFCQSNMAGVGCDNTPYVHTNSGLFNLK